ncbi:WD40 repeat-like protein [Polychaeton citri CBS 116435]|uniref:WD40 repeat-like protein n=1 Tax=Polychaeton citri CBS 116435 TaxID=1314669 RepID=A0A9P4QBI5_9PEZI|nr:WD40 repeat-like protein [Polychaeton citri CBS 116435]
MCAASAAPKQWLQHEYHKVPVTAVAFLTREIILAGEGRTLIAYAWESGRRLWSCRVFKSQSIHGILVCGSNLVVWGGCLLRAIEVGFSNLESIACEPRDIIRIDDWVLDATHLSDLSGILLITAHNALLHYSWEQMSSGQRLSGSHACESLVAGSNCILYSAHVKQLSDSLYLIASGTAFGDIVLWSHDRETEVSKIHHTFPAHEGSIFDVRISHFVCLPDDESRRRLLLASCSDDRTIKVWDVSDLNTESPSLANVHQETGFGQKTLAASYSPPCLGQAMAHLSRVWKVRFLDDTPLSGSTGRSHGRHGELQDVLRLRSFGEDATTLEWLLSPSADGSFELHQLSACRPHTGKNIWSAALGPGLVATGAADGSIAIIPDVGHPRAESETASAVGSVELGGADIRSYVFADHDILIGTDTQGQICEIGLSEASPPNATVSSHIDPVPELRGYSITASKAGVTFIGNSRGQVYAYLRLQQKLVKVAEETKKVTGLFASAYGMISLLVTIVGSGIATLLHCGQEESGGFTFADKASLPMPANRIVTSFVHVLLAHQTLAVVGTRDGSIVVFQVKSERTEGMPQCNGSAVRPKLIKNVHHGEAVTSLSYKLNSDDTRDVIIHLYSTGRDGTFAAHRLSGDGEDLTLETVHQLSTPITANVEGHAITDGGHALVWGFKRDTFVSYDLVLQREVMTVKCGGLHRNWAFQLENEGGALVWTKASQVFQTRQRDLPWQAINHSGHGREIKCVAITETVPQLIATGAEDTDIKLLTYSSDALTCLHTLRKHNTGIQDLKWSRSGHYLFSSGGFEEFYVWRTSHGVPGVGVGVVCESRHPRSGASDLRIMGFDLAEDSAGSSEFTIDMCYSDSSLRRWSCRSGQWQLVGEGSYLTSCLTHALHGGGTLLTAASDGCLASWENEATGDLRWAHRHHVHQNAILAAAQCAFRDGLTMVISGSDDNAIGLTMCHVGEKHSFGSTLIPRAHAAAVTAIAVVERLDEDAFTFVSAGIDQKIRVWRVTRDTGDGGVNALRVERIATATTAVADVSSISMVKLSDGGHGFLICGVGMDMWRLELECGLQA